MRGALCSEERLRGGADRPAGPRRHLQAHASRLEHHAPRPSRSPLSRERQYRQTRPLQTNQAPGCACGARRLERRSAAPAGRWSTLPECTIQQAATTSWMRGNCSAQPTLPYDTLQHFHTISATPETCELPVPFGKCFRTMRARVPAYSSGKSSASAPAAPAARRRAGHDAGWAGRRGVRCWCLRCWPCRCHSCAALASRRCAAAQRGGASARRFSRHLCGARVRAVSLCVKHACLIQACLIHGPLQQVHMSWDCVYGWGIKLRSCARVQQAHAWEAMCCGHARPCVRAQRTCMPKMGWMEGERGGELKTGGCGSSPGLTSALHARCQLLCPRPLHLQGCSPRTCTCATCCPPRDICVPVDRLPRIGTLGGTNGWANGCAAGPRGACCRAWSASGEWARARAGRVPATRACGPLAFSAALPHGGG